MQSLTVAHTWRYHKRRQSVGHVWQGRFKSPVIQDDDHLLTVLRYIEANPLRARMVEDPATYRWSSFPAHGKGFADLLLNPLPEYDELGRTPAERRARWTRKVVVSQSEAELKRIRESARTGKPLGQDAMGRHPCCSAWDRTQSSPQGEAKESRTGRVEKELTPIFLRWRSSLCCGYFKEM